MNRENVLYLNLKAEETFATAMQRMEELGCGTMHVVLSSEDDRPVFFFCLTEDPELAARLKKTTEEYANDEISSEDSGYVH